MTKQKAAIIPFPTRPRATPKRGRGRPPKAKVVQIDTVRQERKQRADAARADLFFTFGVIQGEAEKGDLVLRSNAAGDKWIITPCLGRNGVEAGFGNVKGWERGHWQGRIVSFDYETTD